MRTRARAKAPRPRRKATPDPRQPESHKPEPRLELVAGLGNPGTRYTRTRHNAGFLVLDALARRYGLSFKKGKAAEEARLQRVTLIKPQTFMNLSGAAVLAYSSKLRVPPGAILIVHDDLDLPLGRLRFRTGGSAGGQGGVKDTIARLGPGFHRLKLGIGRPPDGWTVEGWVLSRFQEDEEALVERVVEAAADAVMLALEEGVNAAMNRTNGLNLRPEAQGAGSRSPDSPDSDLRRSDS